MTVDEAIITLNEIFKWMLGDERWTDAEFESIEIAIDAIKFKKEIDNMKCKKCNNYDLSKNGVNGQCRRQYATFYSNDFCSYFDEVIKDDN